MRRSTSSIHHWVCSAKLLADDLGFDPCKDMSFSWSGLKLFVDLQIDSEGPENVENVGETSVADHTSLQDKDPEDGDATKAPGSTGESSSRQFDTDAIKDHLLTTHQNDERACNNPPPPSEVEDECGAAAEPESNWTHCTWPEWGEPLPPEDVDDDIDIDYAADGETNATILKKAVTFSDVFTFVEPSSLQEERETGSFSYAGSSDEELDQGTDHVTSSSHGNSSDLSPSRVSCSREKESLNSADVSAACHLLELGNELNYGDSKALGFESSGESGKRKSDFYDPSHDLERLSELVEKIYASVPQMSITRSSQGSVSSQDVGSWTIEVSKDSGRLRMKRSKREKGAQFEGLGMLDVADDNAVLERPLWRRKYKSLSKFS